MEDEKQKLSLPAVREMITNTRRLTRIILSERRLLFLCIIFLFTAVSALPFLSSWLNGRVVDELVASLAASIFTQQLWLILGAVVLLGVVRPMLFTAETYLSKLLWFFMEERFEMALIEKRGVIDVVVHEDPKNQDLFNKISESGVWRIQSFVDRMFYIVQGLIQVVVAALIILSFKWWVFFVLILTTVPSLLVEAKYGRQVWNIHSTRAEVRRRFWNLRWHFIDLPSLIELKTFQNLKHFANLIRELFTAFRTEERKNDRKRMQSELGAEFVSQLAIGGAIVFFAYSVVQGEISIGSFVFIVGSIGSLRDALSGFFSNLGRQYQDSLFVSDLFKLLDIKPLLLTAEPAKLISLKRDKTPEIMFENVSFAYADQERKVLENVNLTIKPGDKLALVGANGAGKTTLIKLLCRFYDPTSGRILVDGHDLRQVDLESWYYHLGVLFQDYARYNFLAKEAIAVGRTSAKIQMPNVEWAANYSEASDFIKEWEHGYEQMLGKQFTGGVEPSVGQWQKLALARTFYRGANVIILDEPTSSIDAEAEAKIFEKLENLPKDKTVILISHRFSTVRHADQIVVIEDGRISEHGSHEKLLEKNGTYARLFHLQARGYK